MNNEHDKHQGSQTVNPGREQQQQGDKKPGQTDFNRDKQQGGTDDRNRQPGGMSDKR
jgi:hypothetical protein